MPQHCDGLLGPTEAFPLMDAIERTQARGTRHIGLELQNERAVADTNQVPGLQKQA